MLLRTLRASEGGATAIEYGLIAALIAVACITGLTTLGGGTNGLWGGIRNGVTNSTSHVQ
jgi:pilus assembly protein Flp/PilA